MQSTAQQGADTRAKRDEEQRQRKKQRAARSLFLAPYSACAPAASGTNRSPVSCITSLRKQTRARAQSECAQCARRREGPRECAQSKQQLGLCRAPRHTASCSCGSSSAADPRCNARAHTHMKCCTDGQRARLTQPVQAQPPPPPPRHRSTQLRQRWAAALRRQRRPRAQALAARRPAGRGPGTWRRRPTRPTTHPESQVKLLNRLLVDSSIGTPDAHKHSHNSMHVETRLRLGRLLAGEPLRSEERRHFVGARRQEEHLCNSHASGAATGTVAWYVFQRTEWQC